MFQQIVVGINQSLKPLRSWKLRITKEQPTNRETIVENKERETEIYEVRQLAYVLGSHTRSHYLREKIRLQQPLNSPHKKTLKMYIKGENTMPKIPP